MNLLLRKDYLPSAGVPIAVNSRMIQSDIDAHGHQFSEIAIVTSGRALHRTGQDHWRITRGDVFVRLPTAALTNSTSTPKISLRVWESIFLTFISMT